MGFQEEYSIWLKGHTDRRKGERRDRLERGHGHGERMFLEKVWWPLMGSLQNLHPEYEVADWRGRPYFVDFVWKPGQVKFAFEVKGYGPHVQNMDRTRYRQELNRETFLQIAGYRVVSIPYDDLDGSPQLTISLIRSLVAPFISGINVVGQFTRLEREMIRLAVSRDGMIRPVDLGKELGINLRTVRNTLQALCAKGRLRPVSTKSGSRVYRYEVIYSFSDDQLW
ncbi:hypothetical protein SAMN05216191_11597 [Paenibacillus jilunlii]|uniref:DUF559 domain-containing protein n=1 Tax=Paenibacillus jilunlii TaxID=682956 RepID=A0A1G9UW51_9BACL|nr:hypothetical protein AML91_05760 [Paenibacillus jilunlii]SDM64172.1 hypothetical protein SAMN05216191_11597 [Paenibacillus jilunlii]